MKNVVKVLDKNGDAFQYLKNVFLNLSDANVNDKSFLGTQIKKILEDEHFHRKFSIVEKDA